MSISSFYFQNIPLIYPTPAHPLSHHHCLDYCNSLSTTYTSVLPSTPHYLSLPTTLQLSSHFHPNVTVLFLLIGMFSPITSLIIKSQVNHHLPWLSPSSLTIPSKQIHSQPLEHCLVHFLSIFFVTIIFSIFLWLPSTLVPPPNAKLLSIGSYYFCPSITA